MVSVIHVLITLAGLLCVSCDARFESLLPSDGGAPSADGGQDAGVPDGGEPTR